MATGPVPYVGFHKDPHGVRSLWERFNAGVLDIEEGRSPYQQLLLSEWQRCSALGVDVAMTKGRRLSEAEFRHRLDAEQLLLQTSLPVVEDVRQFLIDVPGIVILTESTGTVLHVSGDPAVRELAAAGPGIIEGSLWNELTAGTNGLGTALAKQRPVHVFATEHFCEAWHTWSCAASPIFDIDGQTVLGVIDFTTVETHFREQALGLTVSLANSIQARMSLHRELEQRRVLTVFSDTARRYPNDDLLALDHRDRVVACSQSARCRRVAEAWGRERESPVPLRSRIEVIAPHSGAQIGAVVILAPAGASTRVGSPPHRARSGETIARFGDFLTGDAPTRALFADLERVARADVNLLIVGETGTGKELLARQVHACSARRDEPYLAVNCGAISESLMESTFFGYVRGAFSGADPRGRAGYFESARGGTLFLDEVGELPLAMQAALLRVLEDGSYQRVGACETRQAQCRIVCATHRNLEQMIAEGRFRQDLYFRLKVVQRRVRPLRERPADIGLLAGQFVEAMARKHGLTGVHLSVEAAAALQRYAWPGNARELRNAIEAAVLCSTGRIDIDCLPPEVRDGGGAVPAEGPTPPSGAEPQLSVRDYERRIIVSMLQKHRKANRVAGALGIARSTLYRKFAEFGINPADYTGPDVEPEPAGDRLRVSN